MKISDEIDAKISQLKEHSERSRRVSAEIFATAAELVQDHEFMLQQVSLPLPALRSCPWTIATLQREFNEFKGAQLHFKGLYGVKANGWKALVDKVNTIEATLIYLGLRQRSPR